MSNVTTGGCSSRNDLLQAFTDEQLRQELDNRKHYKEEERKREIGTDPYTIFEGQATELARLLSILPQSSNPRYTETVKRMLTQLLAAVGDTDLANRFGSALEGYRTNMDPEFTTKQPQTYPKVEAQRSVEP